MFPSVLVARKVRALNNYYFLLTERVSTNGVFTGALNNGVFGDIISSALDSQFFGSFSGYSVSFKIFIELSWFS